MNIKNESSDFTVPKSNINKLCSEDVSKDSKFDFNEIFENNVKMIDERMDDIVKKQVQKKVLEFEDVQRLMFKNLSEQYRSEMSFQELFNILENVKLEGSPNI